MEIEVEPLEYEFMEGSNKLVICELALMQAVEYWLNTKVLQQPASIRSIRVLNAATPTYEIEIRSIPHPAAKN